jgi:nucleotide-binding universal stress UspA family protein
LEVADAGNAGLDPSPSQQASREVAKVADEITKSAPDLRVSTQVLEGSPKQLIVDEAEHWDADLL